MPLLEIRLRNWILIILAGLLMWAIILFPFYYAFAEGVTRVHTQSLGEKEEKVCRIVFNFVAECARAGESVSPVNRKNACAESISHIMEKLSSRMSDSETKSLVLHLALACGAACSSPFDTDWSDYYQFNRKYCSKLFSGK